MEAYRKVVPIKQNTGKLSDAPEISINRFSSNNVKSSDILDAKAFFLTHCDYDILANIFESSFLQRLSEDDSRCLYLHQISYQFLLYWTTTISVEAGEETSTLLQQLLTEGKIKLLETNTPIKIYTESSCVTVTPLSAGHHAGSVMLLLEKSENGGEISCRILHTGSCRVNKRDLRLLAPLHDPVTGKPKEINKLYLDTSFCTKNITELPSRRVVTEQLINCCQMKIEKDPELRFEIMDDLVPSRSPIATCAHFLRCVFEKSMEQIHVTEALAAFLKEIPKFPDLSNTEALTTSDESIHHFHCCCGQTNDNELCTEEGEWAIRFEVNEISLQSNFSSRGSDDALKLFTDEKNWKEHGYEKTVYDEGVSSIRAIYCHSLSRYEQARLMDYLNVSANNVYPLYSPFGTTVREMRGLLQEACDVVANNEEPIEIVDDYPSHFYDLTGNPDDNISPAQ